jgi:hypothetical protein
LVANPSLCSPRSGSVEQGNGEEVRGEERNLLQTRQREAGSTGRSGESLFSFFFFLLVMGIFPLEMIEYFRGPIETVEP